MAYLILAAAVFGLCYLLDRSFTKLFRSRRQHQSGLAVKPGKRTATLGVFLALLGVAGILGGISGGPAMVVLSVLMLLLGAALITYYLSFGIYYDADAFLVSSLGKQSTAYAYGDIREQKRYVVQGGSMIVELHMQSGAAVTVQTNMDGAFPFLDYAFARWCEQKNVDPDSCEFHDPSQFRWFPEEEAQ